MLNERLLNTRRVLLLGSKGKLAELVLPTLKAALPDDAVVAEFDRQACPLPDGISQLPRPPATDAPDLVLCFAAITKPGDANANPFGALATNVATVDRLIHHYADTATTLIFASTVRTSATDSMYAWSKIAAEAITATNVGRETPRVIAVRFGNILSNARVVHALVESVRGGGRGRVDEVIEYFQTDISVLAELDLALSTVPSSGSVITPVLQRTPIPFLAGLLSGYAAAKGSLPPDWDPVYNIVPNPPPPVPDWWLAHSDLHVVRAVDSRDGTELTFPFLVTSFKERVDETQEDTDRRTKELAQLRTALTALERPRLGWFAGVLDMARHLDPTG